MLERVEILVVEDYETDAQLFQIHLRRNGFHNKVEVVTDGTEALDFLFARGIHAGRAGEPLPSVVIMDMHLPKMDGLEVLRQLRQDPRTHELPIIIATGSLFEKELEQAARFGATACLAKPVKIPALLEVLKKCGVELAHLEHHHA